MSISLPALGFNNGNRLQSSQKERQRDYVCLDRCDGVGLSPHDPLNAFSIQSINAVPSKGLLKKPTAPAARASRRVRSSG